MCVSVLSVLSILTTLLANPNLIQHVIVRSLPHILLELLVKEVVSTKHPVTRPLKILLYSSDGYTESSVPALCSLMAIKSLNLPEAYLELQVVKKEKVFFVYQADLGILRREEARLKEERGREREMERLNGGFLMIGAGAVGSVDANGKRIASASVRYSSRTVAVTPSSSPPPPPSQKSSFTGRPAAKSVYFPQTPHPMMVLLCNMK